MVAHMSVCVWACAHVYASEHAYAYVGPEEVDSSELRLQAFVGHRDSYVCARIWFQVLKTVQEALFLLIFKN